jgi:hypothetical protein
MRMYGPLRLKLAAMILPVLALAEAQTVQSSNSSEVENVNSRYTVESVDFNPSRYEARLSSPVREQLQRLVGVPFDPASLDELSARVRGEFRRFNVDVKLEKGSKEEHVRVVFQVKHREDESSDLNPRLVYHSRQNWTFGGDLHVRHEGHSVSFGALTDNDELVERYSGIRGGYERRRLLDDRLRIGFILESWRAQWNGATQTALEESPEVPGIYRTRLHFMPSATLTLLAPLTLQVGVSIERFQTQFPTARNEVSSAAVSTLRYQRRWEPSSGDRHDLDASYSLRAATRALESDFVYSRHLLEGHYAWRRGHEAVLVHVMGGALNGAAPLFERFVLGNSRTLRGWNRFDVDPLGGERFVHGSLESRYRVFRVIYDTGALWRRGDDGGDVRHSLACGWTKDGFSALIAFPIRRGAVTPVFILGMNF